MKKFRWIMLLVSVMSLFSFSSVYAEEMQEPPLVKNMLSLHALEADWAFSGTVINESGERYHYFFQLQKSKEHYHGQAALIDGQSKAVLLFEEGETEVTQSELTHWQAGSLFLRFNPISNTWVFGVSQKKNEGKGFNFKIDMLEPTTTKKSSGKHQILAEGVEFLIHETGRLNGHFQINEKAKEEFVTAKSAWFRQIWVNKPGSSKYALTSVLCNFNDGAALYSLGSKAGRHNAEGTAIPMSQFVSTVEGKDGIWQIKIPSKTLFQFENLLAKENASHDLIVGVMKGVDAGFCAVNKAKV